MADYSIKQIYYRNDGSYLQKINSPIIMMNAGDAASGSYLETRQAPYQQIAFGFGNNFQFDPNLTYFLDLKLPKDEMYNLSFGLHLVKEVSGDLDSQQYQFIRYLNIPRKSDENFDYSRVVLYEWPDSQGEYDGYDVKIAIAKEVDNLPDPASVTSEDDIYFWRTKQQYYHKKGSEMVPCVWGSNDTILTHNWLSNSSEEKIPFNIIFRPEPGTSFKYIYLYLIPEPIDDDITWVSSGASPKTMYGRHIDNIPVEDVNLYVVENLLDSIGTNKIRRFGIWGRSELMFAVNGEEIRIGPSGYYELRDFTVNTLGVVAQSPDDKFTIDIQY